MSEEGWARADSRGGSRDMVVWVHRLVPVLYFSLQVSIGKCVCVSRI